jgi:hypothetical protein
MEETSSKCRRKDRRLGISDEKGKFIVVNDAAWNQHILPQHDSFSILFEEVADIAGILVDTVIVTYEDKRIFSSASPHGIGVWAQAELGICAFWYNNGFN